MQVTEKMIDRGLAEYSEGGCMGLDDRERREVVTAILTAALSDQERAVEVKHSEWHRADRPGAGSVMLYTLREEGRRRGEPVMINDVMINVDRGTGASTDIEPIVQRIRSALVDVPVEPVASYFARQIEWSRETFGPALRTKGVIDHIRKELKEIEREPHDLSEWIDVVILAMDGFWRHGGKPDDLMPALLAKQQKNMARVWPDWRTMSEDSAIEHDRTHDASSPPHREGEDSAEVERLAWNCDQWPEWLHNLVDETNEVADRLDMSSEQAFAYAALAATRSASATSASGGRNDA